MYCPRCGADQPLGTRRCARCGQPFTRRAYARSQRMRPAPAVQARTQYREWERGPGVGRRVLGCLAVMVVTVVLLLAGFATFSTVVRPFVARTITERLSPAASLSPEEPVAPPVVSVPTPSPGTLQVTVTQEDLNQRIEANRDRIRPLDSAQVQITSEAFAIELRAFGLTGRYAGQVVVVDGEVQLTNGRITGPLGWLIPVAPLESALNDQLRNGLDQSGVAVDSVTLQEGQMTITLAPAAG